MRSICFSVDGACAAAGAAQPLTFLPLQAFAQSFFDIALPSRQAAICSGVHTLAQAAISSGVHAGASVASAGSSDADAAVALAGLQAALALHCGEGVQDCASAAAIPARKKNRTSKCFMTVRRLMNSIIIETNVPHVGAPSCQ